MSDWLNSLADFFNELGDAVNDIFYNMQLLVENLNYFMQIAQAYIIGSGIVLAIILIIQISTASSVSSLRKEIAQLRTDLRDKNTEKNAKEDEKSYESELHTIG